MANVDPDIAAARAVLRAIENGTMETVPHTVVVRLIGGENPVRVWREHRGLTIAALADTAGLSQPFVSQIETGTREPTVRTLAALARALGVDQFREMVAAKVQLVVPEPLVPRFPLQVQPHLLTLESFIADVRLLTK